MRHQWEKSRRTYGSIRKTCLRCCLIKDSRHAGNHHWTEYKYIGDDLWFESETTPECRPIVVEA